MRHKSKQWKNTMYSAVERSVINKVKSNLEDLNYHFKEGTIINIEYKFSERPHGYYSYKIVGLNSLTGAVNQVAISIFVPGHLAGRDVPDMHP